MSTATQTGLRRLATPQTAVLAVLVVAALVLRWSLFDVVSGDYRSFLSSWYAHLASSGGFAGLADEFSNYNTPYLALLAALTYLPVDPLVGIKAISVLFDLVLAFFAYRIVRVVRPDSAWLPTILTGIVLFLPTVVMNGGAWAQCDSIYGSMILASLYFLITRRPWVATVFFGIAFAFKLQVIFFLPVLVLVLILNRGRLRTLLAAPAAFLAMLVPALIAGRSLLSQLAVYPAQITGGSGTDRHGLGDPARAAARGGTDGVGGGPPGGGSGGGGSGGGGFGAGGSGGGGFAPAAGTDQVGGGSVGTGHLFTYNAPTPYAWLPSDAGEVWKYAGLALAAVVALAFGIWLLRRRRPLAAGEVLLVAAASTMVVPWLLPEMHERYFYLAEVLLVLAIAVDKRMTLPAAAIQVASSITYLSYLGGSDLVPLEITALLGLLAAVSAGVVLVIRLRPRTSLDPSDPNASVAPTSWTRGCRVALDRASRPPVSRAEQRADLSPEELDESDQVGLVAGGLDGHTGHPELSQSA
jgi:Gpi18-like mannosyltransferase